MIFTFFSTVTMPDSTAVFVIICLMIFSGSYLSKRLFPNERPVLPPGPSLISLISQAFQVSSPEEEYTYLKWLPKYGDIVNMSILNKHTIVINSVKTAIEMLESKGSIYSGRELTPMLKLSGWSDFVVFSPPGAHFRQQRAFMHKVLGTQAIMSQHYKIVEDESRNFLRRVSSSPGDLADCVRRFAVSIVLKISYGYTVKEKDDPFVFNAERSTHEVSLAGSPDMPWMVDFFPSLEKLPSWLPGTRFKRLAKQWSDHTQEFINAPFEFVKGQMAAGTAAPSFTSTLLAHENLTQSDEHAIKFASMAIYTGGSDTTVAAIRSFFLAMALNPAVVKKAQKEIDAVVGTQRLPLISDRVHLPYVNALILELFRWAVPVPNAIPHKTTQDDVHAGYFIPEGTIVVPNLRFMMNDPRLYKDPENFMPERFLDEDPESDPREVVFGFGRRGCPGRLLADETVFIICAMSLAVFDIQKKTRNGIVVEPICRMTTGFVRHPEPYEIDIKPRSAQAVALIQAAN